MNEWADGSRVRTTEITAAAAHSGAAGGGNVPSSPTGSSWSFDLEPSVFVEEGCAAA